MRVEAVESETGESTFLTGSNDEESPRVRLELHGVKSLSDAEILSVLLQKGMRDIDAVQLAKRLLVRHGGVSRLASCDSLTIETSLGISPAKSAMIQCAFELGRRAQTKQFNAGDQIHNPKDVADRLIPLMRDLATEQFWVIHLNKANVIIRYTVISKGGVSASIVDAHEVFRLAIIDRSSSILIAHNHPSLNPEPSREDIALTRSLVDAGAVLQMPVYDHIIVAGSQYTSFKERRLM